MLWYLFEIIEQMSSNVNKRFQNTNVNIVFQ